MKRAVSGMAAFICMLAANPASTQPVVEKCRSELRSTLERLKTEAVLREVIKTPDFLVSPIYERALKALDDPDYVTNWSTYQKLQDNAHIIKALRDGFCDEYARETLKSIRHTN